ncbi:MAG: thiamine pyrophosphate-binding protein [Beijerinckiaceae bacterium]|nr:thiamine pyrophosphate-binding protein [Beijerinckiaceae bacterium]
MPDDKNIAPRDARNIELPVPSQDNGQWGSDAVAELLRALDLPYVALNPGASFRGLHDSLVNRLGNRDPQMLLCLHEESAVAIAHGWAKVTGKPLCAIVHSNVGLMHATMAVFNAWCDRAPLLLLGATGPVDAAKRRPWIDWIHTAKDQGALIRDYTKWDDQPGSVPAALESILRAWQITGTAPFGPTYVCLDAAIQEMRLEEPARMPDIARFASPPPAEPPRQLLAEAAAKLGSAKRPLLMIGRVSRSEQDWAARIALAEKLNALVLTDMKIAGAFPTTHRLHAAPPSTFASEQACALIRDADVVLALDWVDLAGTLKSAFGARDPSNTIINVSLDQYLHNGWSMDHQGLPPADLYLVSDPDVTVHALNEKLAAHEAGATWNGWSKPAPQQLPVGEENAPLTVPVLANAVRKAFAGRDISLVRHPLSWAGHMWDVEHPLDFLGTDGGGGIGSGPGTSVGAALALKGGGRIPLAILGDGDFLMGATAVWSAVHYGVPLIALIANNRSFYNDEVHQERVARMRDRPIENKWIGQHIAGPDVDLGMMARAQGATGIGPVKTLADLHEAIAAAIEAFERGDTVVVDVRVEPGYDSGMSSALIKHVERS